MLFVTNPGGALAFSTTIIVNHQKTSSVFIRSNWAIPRKFLYFLFFFFLQRQPDDALINIHVGRSRKEEKNEQEKVIYKKVI